MKRTLFQGMLLFAITLTTYAQKLEVSEKPVWVETPTLDWNNNREIPIGEGFRYLLFENQVNIKEKQVFYRYSMQVLSADGIAENSDLVIEYDPAFQKLEVHEVNIYRDGKRINKLNPSDFKIIQKETSADRNIYDGALSALLHLTDVQKNDIIDYSYTLKGFNPVFGDQFSGFFYHKLGIKVENFNYRIVVPQNQKLQFQAVRHEYKPEINSQNGNDIYHWNHDGLQAVSFDTNVPYWSAMYPMTSYSTFPDWKSVVDWALPLYRYSESEVNAIKSQLKETKDNIARITEIIRFVQDDIRYLGLESGMSSYRPNSPQKVFNQKYGDCKDKSLLLVSLLRSEGIEAFPVLVNTQWKSNVEVFSANAVAFDHCVVTFNWKGEDLYVDPTISNQGGNLMNIYFPDYRKGLVLKPNNSSLTSFPEVPKSVQKVDEFIVVKDLEGNASLEIRTEYRGKRADELRSSFINSTVEEISKSYLDFYAGIYPGIKAAGSIEYLDADRNISNVITTLETYEIENFWQKSEKDEHQLYAEVYPLELNSRISFPKTASREMEYFLGEPEVFSISTKIVMPESWPVQSYQKRIEAGGFVYENEVNGEGNIINISHKYELLKASIPGSDVPKLIEQKNLMANELSFFLTYNPNSSGSVSFLAVFSFTLLLFFSFVFGLKIFKQYNPKPQARSLYDSIGGWLILPSITVIIIPIVVIVNLLTGEYFNNSVWVGAQAYGTSLQVYCVVSFVFLTILFAYSILTLIFFFKLRTAAPQMVIILLVVNFVSLLLDAYVANQYFHELEVESSSRDIGRSIIGLFIWIPYFIKSNRVKSTFTKTYSENKFNLIPAENGVKEEGNNSEKPFLE